MASLRTGTPLWSPVLQRTDKQPAPAPVHVYHVCHGGLGVGPEDGSLKGATWRATVPDPGVVHSVRTLHPIKQPGEGFSKQGDRAADSTGEGPFGELCGTTTRSDLEKRDCSQPTQGWVGTMARVGLFFFVFLGSRIPPPSPHTRQGLCFGGNR